MKNQSLAIKKRTLHQLYLFLRGMIDLSEYIYEKLNYLKHNYKEILIDLFEESDRRTNTQLNSRISSNPIINDVLSWLSGLFGKIEEEIVLGQKQIRKAFSFSKLKARVLNTVSILNYLSFTGIILLFFIYFHFT